MEVCRGKTEAEFDVASDMTKGEKFMELRIISPTEDQFIKSIKFNFEEIRQEMTARLAKYQDLVYTEGTIKDAKNDRATLNKFKDAIEGRRKEVKKQCLAPYEAFEKQIKELVALIDEPIWAIDSQVKTYEQGLRDEKEADIRLYFDKHIGYLDGLLPFERIYNEKWLNAGTKIKDIYAQIDAVIEKTNADLKTIENLKSEFELSIKETYLDTLDLSRALNEKTRLEEQKERMAAYEKAKQAEVAEAEPARPTAIVYSVPVAVAEDQEEPEILTVDFRIKATKEQLALLKEFFEYNKIEYGRVK